MPWIIQFYQTERGERPVRKYLEALPEKARACAKSEIEAVRAMETFDEYLADQFAKSPTFAREYEKAVREMRFAVSLCMLRETRGLTQQALAEKTGIKQPMIARLEKGQIPKVATLQRLAQALNGRVVITAEGQVTIESESRRRSAAKATMAGRA